MEVLKRKELKNVITSVDGYNDYGFDTFSEHLTDYCEEITTEDMVEIMSYLEEELGISTDAELKDIDDSKIEDLCEYINSLFD